MARDLADLAASAARTAEALPAAQKRGVTRAALHVTKVVRSEIASATGGDSRLSGVGKKGARVGAKYDVVGEVNPSALIKGTGPLHLLERDTRAHLIWPKGRTFAATRRGGVRRRGTTRALKIGPGYAAYAAHPGTRGKHTFERAWKAAAPEAARIFANEVRDTFRKAWL